jgi:hypothetical protein
MKKEKRGKMEKRTKTNLLNSKLSQVKKFYPYFLASIFILAIFFILFVSASPGVFSPYFNFTASPSLTSVKFDNGTSGNFTLYDNSLVLMMNFDNVSALGENASKVVDVSPYGAGNGTPTNGAFFNSAGKYGGAMSFNGSDDKDYILKNNIKLNSKIYS